MDSRRRPEKILLERISSNESCAILGRMTNLCCLPTDDLSVDRQSTNLASTMYLERGSIKWWAKTAVGFYVLYFLGKCEQ